MRPATRMAQEAQTKVCATLALAFDSRIWFRYIHTAPMKRTLWLILLFGLFTAGSVSAEPRSITSITTDQLSQLESMHQQAMDLLIKNDFQAALRVYSDIVLMELVR